MTIATWLRTVALAAVVAAVIDPGCVRVGRVRFDVTIAGDLPARAVAETIGAIRDAAPWAVVTLEPAEVDEPDTVAARIVAGDAAPVLHALRSRPASLALEAVGPALSIGSIGMPGRVSAGTRAEVTVRVGGVPDEAGVVGVTLRDAVTGTEQGRGELPATDAVDGHLTIAVPWLATRTGPVRLRAVASFQPADRDPDAPDTLATVRPSPPGDVTADVRPSDVVVALLEARPTWSARFARLALSGAAGLRLASEVRVSPGVAVRTGAGATEQGSDPEVIIVGGLEALTSADVARLDREVRERGRAVVLLIDAQPHAGAWQRLWPDPIGPLRSGARPVTGLVAGHAWTMREWLAPVLSTGATPLAYVESVATPFIAGRAHGAGRVLLVTSLDAWRWRAEPGTAFAAGWRALVQRLAADVPKAVTVSAWGTGGDRNARLAIDVALRPDVAGTVDVTATAAAAGDIARPVPLARMADGRWRGEIRVPGAGVVDVDVTARSAEQVVGRVQTVVDVSPRALVADWTDVEQHQAERGAAAATTTELAASLQALRDGVVPGREGRWHVTRTWWFAGLVAALLGTEWILRRLAGAR